jgi:hypothetical protein
MTLRTFAALTLLFSIFLAPARVSADTAAVVDRTDVQSALERRVLSDEAERDSIHSLLNRDEVRSMAHGVGVDLRRADVAVSTLEGEDLHRVAAQATTANQALAGGETYITISLVAVLLIVIIVILLVR